MEGTYLWLTKIVAPNQFTSSQIYFLVILYPYTSD